VSFGGNDPGADIGDLAVLQDYRYALHFRAGDRIHIDVTDDDSFGGEGKRATE